MSSPNEHDAVVTIVGAGIAGLAAAAALLKMGRRVQVFEQAAKFSRIGTGVGLAPNAMKVLGGLGLRPKLEALAYQAPYRTSRVWDTGEEMVRYPVKGVMEEKYGAPYLLMHRGDLHQSLYELLPEGVVKFGHRLEGVELRDDKVLLQFHGGDSELADIVIGADGVHSPLRDGLLGVDAAKYTGKVAYRSVYSVDLLPEPLMDPNTKWWGPDRHIVMYYISAGREVYFTTSVPVAEWVEESFSAKGDLEELNKAFEGFHPALTSALAVCPSCQKWAIFERDPLPAWRAGSVILLGDACHPMTPFMQQGAATALEDAIVIARCLEESDGADAAYSRFEQARKDRTSIIQAESSKNIWNATSAGSELVSHEFVYTYDAWSVPLP